MPKKQKTKPKPSIGGQALLEGIMMRGPDTTAMAVRDPDGKIVLETFPTYKSGRPKIFKIPVVRGVFNFIDSMRIGYKCLMRSAEIAGLDDVSEKKPINSLNSANDESDDDNFINRNDKKDADNAEIINGENTMNTINSGSSPVSDDTIACDEKSAGGDSGKDFTVSRALMNVLMIFSALLGVLLSVGLFIYLPSQIFSWVSGANPALETRFWRSAFEGLFRITLFVGYMLLVRLMKDIRRTFMFHGAEHKAIFCHESGLELTVENIRVQRRFHPRCGTSFMIIMLIVGIFVSMFISVTNPVMRTLIKLLMMPVVMGIGYELIKLAGRFDNIFIRIISAPGMWLQRITTIEPDDGMIECAISALREALPREDGEDGKDDHNSNEGKK